MGLDCGPATIEQNNETILRAKTILWNGPMGVFEFPAFENGTKSAMDSCVKACAAGPFTS